MSQLRPKPPVVNQVARWLRTAPPGAVLETIAALQTAVGARWGKAAAEPLGGVLDHLVDEDARREGRAETEAWINPPGVVSVPEWLLAAPDDDVLLTLLNVSGRVRDGWGEALAEPIGRVYDQLVERQRAARR